MAFRHLCRGCGSPPGKLMEWHDPLADHSGVEDVVSSLELAGLLEKRSIEDVIVISCDATSSIYIYRIAEVLAGLQDRHRLVRT